jgi:hypothetical protein
VALSLAAGTLHRIKIDLPKRSFFALRHKERYASQAEKALFCLVPDVNEINPVICRDR